jgi:type IV fimbrial biogenesis protein FimT
VSLCPSRNGNTCTPDADWRTGWLVFVNTDRDSPAARDAGEDLLRVYAAWDAGHILSNRTTLSFRPFGQMGVTATVTFCDDRGSPGARAVIISQTGRPRVSSRNASGGALTCT